MTAKRIAVVGGGPAGAAVAIGLRRVGEEVVLVGEPRRFAAVEGVSERVIGGLRAAGFERALRCFAPPSPRCVTWNGVTSRANTEQLVDRQRFDEALLDDVAAHGVLLVPGRVVAISSSSARYAITVEGRGAREVLEADFLVEARGRAAPGQGLPRVRGVETVSLLQYWQGPRGPARSAVQSLADGWAWMAALEDGRRYLQLTLDVASTMLPPKRELGGFCRARLETIEAARPFIHDAEPVGEPHARAATPVLHEAVVGDDWIRVGDAAMAVDPLSGNGIFQAMSSALQAPAVIGTLLHEPSRGALAQRFHRRRIDELFYRFARIGRDFYAQEPRWVRQPFWQLRRQWPDAEPIHAPTTPETVRIARMPVVADGRIVEEEVVVTPEQPLGIWHVDGVRLAPLLRAARTRGAGASIEEALRAQAGVAAADAARLAAWMRARGWVG
ncbi:MAG TPA: FAD-dependent oxidoreductase [Rhodocyclaceae bacterium]|nr:FAD-dependent oxidoreductase [Rhodocyclaceae bacterium]